jgi:hypothetical protein
MFVPIDFVRAEIDYRTSHLVAPAPRRHLHWLRRTRRG